MSIVLSAGEKPLAKVSYGGPHTAVQRRCVGLYLVYVLEIRNDFAARFLPGDGIDRFLQNVSEIVVQRQQMVHLLVYVVGETDVNYPVFAVQNLEYACEK